MDDTDRRSVIAGGVTTANLPHFFRNSRRASAPSRPSDNSGELLMQISRHNAAAPTNPSRSAVIENCHESGTADCRSRRPLI
jgi:hypothetical protein